jgi:hypothetical protein
MHTCGRRRVRPWIALTDCRVRQVRWRILSFAYDGGIRLTHLGLHLLPYERRLGRLGDGRIKSRVCVVSWLASGILASRCPAINANSLLLTVIARPPCRRSTEYRTWCFSLYFRRDSSHSPCACQSSILMNMQGNPGRNSCAVASPMPLFMLLAQSGKPQQLQVE